MQLKTFARTSIELRATRKIITEHLKTQNLTKGEFEILYLLKDKQLIQPSLIAVELVHDAGYVSRILNTLHQSYYISYKNDALDRRRILVQITDDGEQLINSLLDTDETKTLHSTM